MGIERDGDRIVLTGSTSVEFLNNVFHPDPEVVRKRDKYFKKLDEIKITRYEDGSFTVDIPWLEIPDFEEQLEEL